MKSDSPDELDIKALLAHLQQQRAQGSGPALAPNSLHFVNHQQGTAAPTGGPGASNESSAWNSLLTGYLKAKGSAVSSARAQAALPPQPHHNQTNNSAHQLQNLLDSAKLLSSVNPKLAAQAMDQALALTSQVLPPPMAPGLNGQQQNASLSSFNPQVLSLLNSRQQDNKLHRISRGHSSLSNDLISNASSSSINSQNLTAYLASLTRPVSDKSSASSCMQSARNGNISSTGSCPGKHDSSKIKFTKAGSTASLPPRLQPLIAQADTTSAISLNGVAGTTEPRTKPPSPVPLPILQTWDLAQLESYAQRFKDCNQTIPNVVNILLEDAYKKVSRRDKKRLANRKSASTSRARQKQLIDELTAANAKLRRQALVLSYLPDPAVAVSTDGKINFCSVQMGRVLKHDVEDLEGASIDDIIVPTSRDKIHRLIQDLVAVADLAGQSAGKREGVCNGGNSSGERRDLTASGESSSSPNAISRASDRSFPMLEVNLDEEHEADVPSGPSSTRSKTKKHKSSSTTMSSLTQKSSTSTSETSTAEDSDTPPAKKAKAAIKDKEEVGGQFAQEVMNVDNIMGAPVTANNANAKLSSMVHRAEKELEKTEDSTNNSSQSKADQHRPSLRRHVKRVRSPSQPDKKQEESVDSGYRNSNESSDDYTSSISGHYELLKKEGRRRRPLAPACTLWLICSDLTTIFCEVTSSIRYRTYNDEDSELGIIDHNPKAALDAYSAAQTDGEMELLLCFRPLSQGKRLGEGYRFQPRTKESRDGTEEAMYGKSSPQSDEGKDSLVPLADAASAETMT